MGSPSSILGLFPVLWDRYGPLVWPGSRCEGQCPPGLAPRIPSLVMGKLGMIQLLPGVGNADTSQPQSSLLGKPLIVKKIIKKIIPLPLLSSWTLLLIFGGLHLCSAPVAPGADQLSDPLQSDKRCSGNNIKCPGGTGGIGAPKRQQTCRWNLLRL